MKNFLLPNLYLYSLSRTSYLYIYVWFGCLVKFSNLTWSIHITEMLCATKPVSPMFFVSMNEDTIFSSYCETGVHFNFSLCLTPHTPEKILLDLSPNYIQNLANFHQLPNQHHSFSHLDSWNSLWPGHFHSALWVNMMCQFM